MAELGEEFRAARVARALSLSDVSEQIHIRSVYLEGIENGDWSSIGAPVYVRGFLRTYARFLGLDPEAAVAAYAARSGTSAVTPTAPARSVPISMRSQSARTSTPTSKRSGGVPPVLAMLSVVAVLVIGAVVYLALAPPGADSKRARVVDAVSAPPVAVVAAPTAVATVAAVRPSLGVRLTQSSWLRVVVDGRPIVEGIYPAGTRKAFSGGTIDVRAGNAGGVDLVRNGKPLGPMGPAGNVVERSIKLTED